MLFFRSFTHARGDRTNQSVAEQDAEESADQRGGNFFTNLFRWAAESSHGDDDSKYGGDDAEPGQRVGGSAERGNRFGRAAVVDFHVGVQHLVQIEYFDAAADRHAHGVANEVAQVVIGDEILVLGEKRALGRIFNVAFERDQSFLARFLQQFVHHFERVDIALPGEF